MEFSKLVLIVFFTFFVKTLTLYIEQDIYGNTNIGSSGGKPNTGFMIGLSPVEVGTGSSTGVDRSDSSPTGSGTKYRGSIFDNILSGIPVVGTFLGSSKKNPESDWKTGNR